MRTSSRRFLFLFPFLVPCWTAAAPVAPLAACVVATPLAAGEPPAWLLLAAAVLLLGAGRLAAS